MHALGLSGIDVTDSEIHQVDVRLARAGFRDRLLQRLDGRCGAFRVEPRLADTLGVRILRPPRVGVLLFDDSGRLGDSLGEPACECRLQAEFRCCRAFGGVMHGSQLRPETGEE